MASDDGSNLAGRIPNRLPSPVRSQGTIRGSWVVRPLSQLDLTGEAYCQMTSRETIFPLSSQLQATDSRGGGDSVLQCNLQPRMMLRIDMLRGTLQSGSHHIPPMVPKDSISPHSVGDPFLWGKIGVLPGGGARAWHGLGSPILGTGSRIVDNAASSKGTLANTQTFIIYLSNAARRMPGRE